MEGSSSLLRSARDEEPCGPIGAYASCKQAAKSYPEAERPEPMCPTVRKGRHSFAAFVVLGLLSDAHI